MKLLAVLLILAAFPVACAEGGLFVSRHKVTYTLGESDFAVEEVIVFENMGTLSSNLFKDNVYLTRGNAWGVEVDVIGKDMGHSVKYLDQTVININLLLWRGEKREVTLKYRRSDMLFRGDVIHVFSGNALGIYQYWTLHRASVKFIAPAGFLFGNVTPYATKVFEDGRETLTYDLAPVNIENLTAIRDGLPVRIEYAKYGEMAITEMKNAREFVGEAESDLRTANKSVENARSYGSNMTQILTLFAGANDALDDSKDALELAEVRSNPYSAEYGPYEAYYHARKSKNFAKEASGKAEESKDLANYEIQRTLEERISGIGSQLSEQVKRSDAAQVSEPDRPNAVGPLVSHGVAIILILAALVMVIFGAYMYRHPGRDAPTLKRSKVEDFKAINELKYKTFKGFDKKLDTVKYGTELAAEIRRLMRKMGKLELGIENLRKKKVAGEISEHAFKADRKKLKKRIEEAAAEIDGLQVKLKESKKAKI